MGLIRYIKNQFRHDRNTKWLIRANATSIANLSREQKRDRRIDWLKDKVMTCTEPGITDERYSGEEVIVSLTSFGNRIYEVYLAIESIMQGTLKPNRILLWLSKDEFRGKILPRTLQFQQKRGLEICFCEDIRSYKKILPTMKQFRDACVVTIDDDLMYEFDLLESLLRAHIDDPESVCACRMHRITMDEHKMPKSYLDWDFMINPENRSNYHFLTSGGGTLFPPHCFVDEFYNQEAFMTLCPFADDIWINAMILLSGRHISKVYTHSKDGCDYLEIRLDQDDALSKENVHPSRCRNDVQFKAVCDRYDLYEFWKQQEE